MKVENLIYGKPVVLKKVMLDNAFGAETTLTRNQYDEVTLQKNGKDIWTISQRQAEGKLGTETIDKLFTFPASL